MARKETSGHNRRVNEQPMQNHPSDVEMNRLSPEALKAEVRRLLYATGEPLEQEQDSALTARWPEPVLALPTAARDARVRTGRDTVLLDDEASPAGRRGFVRAVLRVPLGHEQGQVYGVFIEVDREGYLALKRAFDSQEPTRVWGRLATRLPLLEDAYGSEVELLEDGSDLRTRVVAARHPSIVEGPAIGPA
jgi:hypothetical protein